MVSLVITETDLAELYAVALPSGAALHRERAEEEQADEIEALRNADAALDLVYEAISGIEDPKGDKHNETCRYRHAPCLAKYLLFVIENGEQPR
jgi:hypothetical protein